VTFKVNPILFPQIVALSRRLYGFVYGKRIRRYGLTFYGNSGRDSNGKNENTE
jgi:hypothetical protein